MVTLPQTFGITGDLNAAFAACRDQKIKLHLYCAELHGTFVCTVESISLNAHNGGALGFEGYLEHPADQQRPKIQGRLSDGEKPGFCSIYVEKDEARTYVQESDQNKDQSDAAATSLEGKTAEHRC